MTTAIPTHKICTQCSETKLLEDYHKQLKGRYGRTSECKECRSFNAKLYYVDNSEKIRKRVLKYCMSQREYLRERGRKYCAANREKVLERNTNYRKENPEIARESTRKYHAVNRDKIILKRRDKVLNLSDSYVRACIVQDTSLSAPEIPDELDERT